MLHTQELVLKHAVGLATRSSVKKGGVYDKFEEGLSLKKKVKLLLSAVMNKKSKGRWKEFEKVARRDKETIPKFIIPNETRCSGIFMMFQSALRGKWTLDTLDQRSLYRKDSIGLMLNNTE